MSKKSKVTELKHTILFTLIIFVVVIIIGTYVYVTQDMSDRLVIGYSQTNSKSFSEPEVAAASLAFQSARNSFSVGDTVNLILVVNSQTRAMNTAGGTVVFDPKKLQLTGISKENSIISLWINDPSISISDSSNGSIVFLGGITSPGFIGNQGQIISISFKVIATGNTSINVVNPQVLANDGLGTDLAASVISSQIVLKEPVTISSTDINNDGKVDMVDFSVVLSNYGKKVDASSVSKSGMATVTTLSSSDFNSDGVVDIKDISILLSRFTLKK